MCIRDRNKLQTDASQLIGRVGCDGRCAVTILIAQLKKKSQGSKEKMELYSFEGQNENKSERWDFCTNRENDVFFQLFFTRFL